MGSQIQVDSLHNYSSIGDIKKIWHCCKTLKHFVLNPIILFGAGWANVEIPELPAFDMDSLMTVLLGMLGLGGLRSYEKSKGLTK